MPTALIYGADPEETYLLRLLEHFWVTPATLSQSPRHCRTRSQDAEQTNVRNLRTSAGIADIYTLRRYFPGFPLFGALHVLFLLQGSSMICS